jgi:hypothetical protein
MIVYRRFPKRSLFFISHHDSHGDAKSLQAGPNKNKKRPEPSSDLFVPINPRKQ